MTDLARRVDRRGELPRPGRPPVLRAPADEGRDRRPARDLPVPGRPAARPGPRRGRRPDRVPRHARARIATSPRAIASDSGSGAASSPRATLRRTAVARLGAEIVDGLLEPGESIGIAWGSTVARVVRAMPPPRRPVDRRRPARRQLDVARRVAAIRATSPASSPSGSAGATTGSTRRRSSSPRSFGRPSSASREVAATVERFASIDVAVVGIGAFGVGRRRAALVAAPVGRPDEDRGRAADAGSAPSATCSSTRSPPTARSSRRTSPRARSRSRSTSSAGSRASSRSRPGRPRSRRSAARSRTGVVGVLVTDAATARAMPRDEPPRRPRLPRHRIDRDRRARRRCGSPPRARRVFIVSRTADHARGARRPDHVAAGGAAAWIAADLTDETAVDGAVDGLRRPDSAGSTASSPSPAAAAGGSATARSTPSAADAWDRTLELNLHDPGARLPQRRRADAGPGAERRRGRAARSC